MAQAKHPSKKPSTKPRLFGTNIWHKFKMSTHSANFSQSTQVRSKKRRQKSADDIRAEHFLVQTLAPFKKVVYQSWLIELFASMVLVVQYYVLAVLVTKLFAKNTNQLWTLTALFALCLFIRPILLFFKDKLLTQAAFAMASEVRGRMLWVLGKLGAGRATYGSDGELAQFVVDEPDGLMGYLRFKVQSYVALTVPLLLLVVIACVSLPVAFILALTVPFLLIAMMVIGIATAKKSREQMDALARLGGRFLDWLRGLATLKRLRATDIAKQDIATSADDYERRTMSVLKIAFLNTTALELLSSVAIALVAIYLGLGLLGAPYLTAPSFFVALFVLLLTPEFYAPLRKLGAEYHAKGQAIAAAKKLSALQNAVANQNTADGSLSDDCLVDLSKDVIVIDTVEVMQEGRTRLRARDISITPKQKVAIVGASGAGKSTLMQVLMGFCHYEGKIDVGQSDFGAIAKQQWQSLLAYLPQTPALLPMSIADNLRLAGQVGAEDMKAVLDKVGLKPLIEALPEGLNTVLSERGGGLSGGQAQRLAIAQLLLQDSPLWLIDEPTEHLDDVSKQQIMDLLQQVTRDKTVIWVTHDTPADWMDVVYHLHAPHQNTMQPQNAKQSCDGSNL